MASGKVARRTVVSDVAALLDSPEIAALIVGIGDAGDKRGRKGYLFVIGALTTIPIAFEILGGRRLSASAAGAYPEH